MIKEARQSATEEPGAKSRGLGKAPAFDFLARAENEEAGKGGFVAFYAAQSTQETLELEFDEIVDGQKALDRDGWPHSRHRHRTRYL